MRGFLAILFLVLVALAAGAIGYQAGIASSVPVATAGGASVVYVGGWAHPAFFPFFPFFLFVPFAFLFLLGLMAFAFGGRRRHWTGRGSWTDGPGPTGGGDPRREWIAEAHRRLHEEEAARGASTGTTGTPGSADTTGERTADDPVR